MTIVKIEEECGRRIVAHIEEGIKGVQGMDAYEVALLEGFVGSREEWLESLIGPPVPVAQELGDDPNLAVSQKLLKDSIIQMEINNSTVVSDAKIYSDASKASADASAKSAAAAKGSENLVESYKNAAKVSETNSKASELAAAKSEGNASKSEAAALVSEGKAKDSETKASSSAAAALSSEKASDVSAKAAKASETASKASETAASKSQTAAKASQDAAKTSETNALASRNAAATSETNSKASETAAKASETKSKASETASADSAKYAGISATNADTSAKAAKASETAANSSKTAAATSAKNAKTSETNAKASEVAAKASETASSESETKAKASETAAKTSETKASASELAAKSSETKAAASEKVAVEAEAKAQIALDAATKLEPEIRSNATKADTSAKAAKASEELAKKWANNPVNSPVQGEEYSAMHWAEIAKGNANGDKYLTKSGNLSELTDASAALGNLSKQLLAQGKSAEDQTDAILYKGSELVSLGMAANTEREVQDNDEKHKFIGVDYVKDKVAAVEPPAGSSSSSVFVLDIDKHSHFHATLQKRFEFKRAAGMTTVASGSLMLTVHANGPVTFTTTNIRQVVFANGVMPEAPKSGSTTYLVSYQCYYNTSLILNTIIITEQS